MLIEAISKDQLEKWAYISCFENEKKEEIQQVVESVFGRKLKNVGVSVQVAFLTPKVTTSSETLSYLPGPSCKDTPKEAIKIRIKGISVSILVDENDSLNQEQVEKVIKKAIDFTNNDYRKDSVNVLKLDFKKIGTK